MLTHVNITKEKYPDLEDDDIKIYISPIEGPFVNHVFTDYVSKCLAEDIPEEVY